jgi:hypothetical protein
MVSKLKVYRSFSENASPVRIEENRIKTLIKI